MKKKYILLFLLFYLAQLTGFSQNNHNDYIIPISSSDTLFDCQVLKIDGPIVTFEHHGLQKKITAKCINWDGKTILLLKPDVKEFPAPNGYNIDSLNQLVFQGHQYPYYFSRAKYAGKNRKMGKILTLSFGGAALLSAYPVFNYTKNNHSTTEEELYGLAMNIIWLGAFSMSQVGISIWISNSIKYKNEMEALSKCKNNNLSLKLGVSSKGLGLVLKF